ncbi:homocysteine S-methyltransferase family protein [Oceanirhabdus seepicola]|uniref:Homocysteine S-methyltransferase family protein n=1 Tax=Oceanirhabdus seepicola TaxID=2828781 RepID=A0A9J6NXI0_9CLOT|nr:homocysteine S-methyltransferase family protein [Oceanirhabdus seepicola]MCM1989215.1 homocysteine S-methyltransferase family protein [Oceanirhabdus seepicola]
MSNILDFMKNKVVFFDGAMGTEIDRRGLDISKGVMKYNMTHSEFIKNIHDDYLDAGVDIITTNTLTANELFLKDSGYTSREIIEKAIQIANESVKGLQNKFIAQVVGPAAYLIKDNEDNKDKILYSLFKNQVEIGEKAGVDLILIETMYTLKETEIALKAVRENSSLPIFCTVVLNDKGETFDGKGIKDIVEVLQQSGVSALGINCTAVSDELIKNVEDLMKYTNVPVIVQPNMGMPKEIDGKKIYSIDTDEYVDFMLKLQLKGVKIIGGCCGTTPECLCQLKKNI